MSFELFQTNGFGMVVYSIYLVTTAWILLKKERKWLSILFPVLSLIEGLFIDWRWNRLQYYDGWSEMVLGGLPSLLIAIGFPFVGFYLHHFLPSGVRAYLNENGLFPFSTESLEKADLKKYFQRGFLYSFSTLMLHEASQILELSSRNTFDPVDLIFIIVGSVISVVLYQVSGVKEKEKGRP